MKLSTPNRLSFTKRYGKILELLRVDVQDEAISALVQYYDPPLRCFTFEDFQLAPTLEEYEQIIDLSLEAYKPYSHPEHNASIHTIASAIGMSPHDLQPRMHNRGQVRGFSLEFLEERLNRLAEDNDWGNYMSTLAMTIYGIVLFPHADNFVDLDAIDVFLARKNKAENPVTALLADLYSTLTFCHDKRKKKLLCCLPMLYIWITSHVFQRTVNTKCPIFDCVSYQITKKGKKEWAETLAGLNERQVRWHPSWQQRTKLIYYCQGYPNVPLLGTKSCINYNPFFGQRQLAYPIRGAPEEEMLTPTYFYYADGQYTEEIRRVREAWKKVVYKDKGTRSFAAREGYQQWLRERVEQVKLPFRRLSESQEQQPAGNEEFQDEEVRGLKAKLAEVTAINHRMQTELLKAQQDYAALVRERTEQQEAYESLGKKRKNEEDYAAKVYQNFRAANKELKLRVKEKNAAIQEVQSLKEAFQHMSIEKARLEEVNRKLNDDNLQLWDQQMETLERVAFLEEQITEIEAKSKEMEEFYERQVQIDRRKAQRDLKELTEKVHAAMEVARYKGKMAYDFSKKFDLIATLAAEAIQDLPKLIGEAEAALLPSNTPHPVRALLDYCRELLMYLKLRIRDRDKNCEITFKYRSMYE